MDDETQMFKNIVGKVREENAITSDSMIDISKETELLVEVKDIRDELKILTMVNQNQEGVVSDFIDFANRKRKRTAESENWGTGLRNLLNRHRSDVNRM